MVDTSLSEEQVSLREAAMKIATGAAQADGGYGFIKEDLVEKLMHDAKIMRLRLNEGISQTQRRALARARLLARRADEAAVAA